MVLERRQYTILCYQLGCPRPWGSLIDYFGLLRLKSYLRTWLFVICKGLNVMPRQCYARIFPFTFWTFCKLVLNLIEKLRICVILGWSFTALTQ